MWYIKLMALPELQYAVYYGTITLIDGSIVTYTAQEVAELYGIGDEDYLAVPLSGVSPFEQGVDEVSYVHLKPQRDPSHYYDPQAPEKYNSENEEWVEPDFDAREGGKWEVPLRVSEDDN